MILEQAAWQLTKKFISSGTVNEMRTSDRQNWIVFQLPNEIQMARW